MRKLNDMYHVEGERLVKTSNGQFVPDDEPLFILRGRDGLAHLAIRYYREECLDAGTPADRLAQLDEVLKKFEAYGQSHPTKIPGSTHGA